jgi:hypothetical protein
MSIIASLREQGVLDKTKRRTAIFNIYKNAGYEDDYVNNMLDRYGYDEGGLAMLKRQYDALVSKMRAPETVARSMSNRLKKRKSENDDNDGDMVIPPKKPNDTDEDEEPVLVKDVDRDLAGGLMAAAQGVEKAFGRGFGEMEPVPMLRFARGGEVDDDGGIMDKINKSMERDYDYFTKMRYRKKSKESPDLDSVKAYDEAEQEAMDMVINKYTKGGFARGGEVEIEEETDDLGIMDLMRDQGVEYGEQVSNAQNDEILERLFEEFLDLGFSPEDAAKEAREAFDNMSQGQGITGILKWHQDIKMI